MKENPYSDMDEKAYRVAYLIAGFIRHRLTEKEHDELDNWVTESDHNMQLFEDLTDENNLAANLEWMDHIQAKKSYESMQQKGAFNSVSKKIYNRRIWLAAASVIILIVGFFIYKYSTSKSGNVNDINDIVNSDTTLLKPGGNRATLTLEDGKIIDLTYAKPGVIEDVSGAHLSKAADGELVYDGNGAAANAGTFHTLSTPAGGQFQLTLPDGTKVWLNAATTIKYPVAFTGSERNVEVKGEAYFEVAKNEKQPFKALLEDSTVVTVTGTHFNIMAYQNDKDAQVTLLEGSVLVKNMNAETKLEPGTQAVIKDRDIVKKIVTNADEITGWKEGLFVFHDAPIETIMMQIERWYDAKIVFKGEIKQLFNANIRRSEPLTKVLKLLELNGYVHFKIENKTIYVLP
ncbi:MAG: FecR domain-containing protein [Sediminibacterium magnilacihabitans]|jgi:transmembrane sensor|nr:FecR domain-containing protein [Sediminibacterium magnilacihabitans]PQV62135.1 FecR family protein [Sediminibacterium magnilacihabitans]